MTISFYGNIIEYTNGIKSHEINNCANIRELIEKLGDQFGDRLKNFLLGEETCFILVNGMGLMLTGGLDTKLKASNKIEILPFADAG